jgi:hypothetical protein
VFIQHFWRRDFSCFVKNVYLCGMFTIQRHQFETAPKAWEIWQNHTAEERLIALERLRQLAYTLANNGKPLPDYDTLRSDFQRFFKITKRKAS